VVYITEAHASNMWQMASNIHDGVIFVNPTTNVSREQVAQACVRNLHIAIPALVDSIENRVEKDYTGWPDRLYLVGKDGRVRFKSQAGPFGFHPAGLESAIKDELRSSLASR
jgi:Iodothyronine deiodinase